MKHDRNQKGITDQRLANLFADAIQGDKCGGVRNAIKRVLSAVDDDSDPNHVHQNLRADLLTGLTRVYLEGKAEGVAAERQRQVHQLHVEAGVVAPGDLPRDPAEAHKQLKEHFAPLGHPELVPEHPIMSVFREVIEQLVSGKGEERHGRGAKSFFDQPWYRIARAHGLGFLTGQAAKKLDEAQLFVNTSAAQWRREMLGVIAYASMALLFTRRPDEARNEATDA